MQSIKLFAGYGQVVVYLISWGLLGIATPARGQGTVNITFDGPPLQPPGTAVLVQGYYEAGVRFRPLLGSDGFVRVGSDPNPARPDNGSAYLQASFGDSLAFSFDNGNVFSLDSVDLA